MKNLILILTIVIVLNAVQAWAFQPIIPPPNDYNWSNVKANFDSIQIKRVTLTSGNTTQTFTFPCLTTSPVFATINTSTTCRIQSAVPTGDQVIVTLDAAAGTNLEISLFTILNN